MKESQYVYCPNCGKRNEIEQKNAQRVNCILCNSTFIVKHSGKKQEISNKTLNNKVISKNWGAFLLSSVWLMFNGNITKGILVLFAELIIIQFFYGDAFLFGSLLDNLQPYVSKINIPDMVLGFSILFIIIITIIVKGVLLLEGNRIAMKHHQFESFEKLQSHQSYFTYIGVVLYVISVVIRYK